MKAYKNRYLMTGTMTTLLACLLLFSCNNDDFLDNDSNGNIGKYCDHICFGISGTGSPLTRGTVGTDKQEYTAGRFVLRSTDSPDTLCVRTTVFDGIDCSSFSGETPMTRSAPVSSLEEYDKFHVQAHCKDNGTLVNTFYMDDDATYHDGNWSTKNVHYWPGATRTLQFFAWAPVDAELVAPEAPSSTMLTYTVPTAVNAQKDLVVAKTEEIKGDKNEVVPLVFNHICTAVRFVTGSQMQPGTIKSVALKGVRYKGSYDMAAGKWAQDNDVTSFTQSLDKEMNGNETDGTEVAAGEGTFMMLPQTLPDNAKVEVVFHSTATNTDRTLEAVIGGMEWPQGKTVTYKLSISPEYDMSIECAEKVDAHVDIQEIHITADGPWTLSSDVDWLTFTDWSYDESKPEERPLGHRGYWIRSERGKQIFTGNGDKTLYAYYDEHLGVENRTATMTLTYPNNPTAEGYRKTVTQYCPAWVGNIGYERFEEDHRWEEDGSPTFTYPYGFAWDRKVTFTAEPDFNIQDFSMRDLFGAYVFRFIANNAIENYNASKYVSVEVERFLVFVIKTIVTIDYSKFNAIGDLITADDGLANTRNLYGFQNIGQISAIENILRDNAVGDFTENVISDSHGNIPVDQFAARRIAMKNEFQKVIREETEQGETIRYAEAFISTNDIHWYLPASNEQVSLKDGLTEGDEPLEGEYWSSTAVSDNKNAYKYTPDGNQISEDRMQPHKMRAAVRKSN